MRMGIAAGNVLALLVLHINFLSFEIDETLGGNLSSPCVDYSRRSPILNSEFEYLPLLSRVVCSSQIFSSRSLI